MTQSAAVKIPSGGGKLIEQLAGKEMISLLKKMAFGELENLHAIIDDATIANGLARVEMSFTNGAYSVKVDNSRERNDLFKNIVAYLERIKQDNINNRVKVALGAGLCKNYGMDRNVTLPKCAPQLWPGKSSAKTDPDVFFREHYGKFLKHGFTWALLEDIDPKLKNAVRNFEKTYLRPWPKDLFIETTRSRLKDALQEVEQATDFREVPIAKLAAVARKLTREGKTVPARPTGSNPTVATRRYPSLTPVRG